MEIPTHNALVIVAPRAPYEVRQYPTITPTGNEVKVRVQWTTSTPFDLHQADGGLLVEPPFRPGLSPAGVVVEVGPDVKHFRVGDAVVGFAHQQPQWKAHQEYSTAPEWVFGKFPDTLTMQQAVTVTEDLATAFNTLVTDLRLPAPWPKPQDYIPPRADERILIWGAASCVGQVLIQVLKYYGYRHIVGTASPHNHELLKKLGVESCFDYKSPTVIQDILRAHQQGDGPAFPLIVDCIGSQAGSVAPVSKLAGSGATVAVMLPVIVKHATDEETPEFLMEGVEASAQWAEGVTVHGVRTFLFWKNEFFRDRLLPEIMPQLLAEGHLVPLPFQVVEGRDLLERATNALNLVRKGVSGKKLIWRVSEE
ncbi:GroES-like protein [Durotheca rogersii]|uniref:GroES-like protein n=1 Tax=Durotheca rogersii TaxID=419775 RepID=UPI0022208375|nr:GroES-like protein [Durotheca rogersii]KAI5853653.1 GroES-like protein [Durotheca rogersii]